MTYPPNSWTPIIIDKWQSWRNDDHEDMATISRNEMITLLQEIDRLRAELAEFTRLKEYAKSLGQRTYLEINAENAELREALTEFAEFAWTAIKADCGEARRSLNGKIDRARAVLAKAKESA
jgi:hypothetical protein